MLETDAQARHLDVWQVPQPLKQRGGCPGLQQIAFDSPSRKRAHMHARAPVPAGTGRTRAHAHRHRARSSPRSGTAARRRARQMRARGADVRRRDGGGATGDRHGQRHEQQRHQGRRRQEAKRKTGRRKRQSQTAKRAHAHTSRRTRRSILRVCPRSATRMSRARVAAGTITHTTTCRVRPSLLAIRSLRLASPAGRPPTSVLCCDQRYSSVEPPLTVSACNELRAARRLGADAGDGADAGSPGWPLSEVCFGLPACSPTSMGSSSPSSP